jgi:tetratricopeptide (TPR) repeat protein
LLSEPERLAFMQCSVFRGSFTLAAAEAVVVAPVDGPSAVLPLLQALREQSILMSAPLAGSSAVSVRLTLSAAVREFAQAQLVSARAQYPQLAELETRHARYYSALARARDAVMRPVAIEPRSLERREHDNLRAAAEHMLEVGDAASAAAILFALEPAILAAGIQSPLVALLERALAAADMQAPADLDLTRVRARLRGLHARLLAPAGELAQAQSELERAREEAASASDPWLRGVTALDLGVVFHFGRKLDRAAECYSQALDALEDADDVVAEARCHGNLGAVAHDQGRMHEAADGYRQAIALLDGTDEPRLRANFRGNLALLEHEAGRFDAARQLYQQAALELEESADARLLGIVLGNWGTLELQSERRELAERIARQQNFDRASPRAKASDRPGARTRAVDQEAARAQQAFDRVIESARSVERDAERAQSVERGVARTAAFERNVEQSRSHDEPATARQTFEANTQLPARSNPEDHRAYALFSRAQALLDGCGDRRSLGLAAARLGAVHALERRIDDAQIALTRADRQLRRDPLGKIVAACLRGFLELARAENAAESGDSSGAQRALAQARRQHEHAVSAEHAGRSAREQSDDLRLFGDVLAKELARAVLAIQSGSQAVG